LIPDAKFVLGPVHVFVKILSEGPHFHIEDRGLDIAVMLFGDNRLFGCIHAADRRAPGIRIVTVPGSHTLDPCHLLRMLIVTGTLHFPPIGTRCGQNPLKLNGGHDIRPSTVAQLLTNLRVVAVQSRCQNHRSHIDIKDLILVFPKNRIGWAEFLTGLASASLEKEAVFSVNDTGIRQCLGKEGKDCFSVRQALLVLTGDFLGALLFTNAASGAFLRIHISGLLPNSDFEVTRFPFN